MHERSPYFVLVCVWGVGEDGDVVSLPVVVSDPAIRAASKALPRIDGSSTIWLSDASVFVPSGRSRLTRIVTIHKPVTVPCSQSMDHCQFESSSNETLC